MDVSRRSEGSVIVESCSSRASSLGRELQTSDGVWTGISVGDRVGAGVSTTVGIILMLSSMRTASRLLSNMPS